MGGVDGLLDGLARPNDLVCAPAEPIAVASTTPLATNRVRAMVANNTMVRLIRSPPSVRGRVSSVGRLNSRRPLSVTCLAYLRIGTGVSLKWAIFVVTWAWLAGSELSENSVKWKSNFRESIFHALG